MTYLVVVDMQRDFVDGALGTPEARTLPERVAARICRAKASGETVCFTMDTHGADYGATLEGQNLPVAHCLRGTPGWALTPAVEAVRDSDMKVFEKNTFGSLALCGYLADEARRLGFEGGRGLRVELCGLCADICVASNALLLRAALPDATLVVDPSLTEGVTPEKKQAALDVLASCQVYRP